MRAYERRTLKQVASQQQITHDEAFIGSSKIQEPLKAQATASTITGSNLMRSGHWQKDVSMNVKETIDANLEDIKEKIES